MIIWESREWRIKRRPETSNVDTIFRRIDGTDEVFAYVPKEFIAEFEHMKAVVELIRKQDPMMVASAEKLIKRFSP